MYDRSGHFWVFCELQYEAESSTAISSTEEGEEDVVAAIKGWDGLILAMSSQTQAAC
jgi:hypothetical protein